MLELKHMLEVQEQYTISFQSGRILSFGDSMSAATGFVHCRDFATMNDSFMLQYLGFMDWILNIIQYKLLHENTVESD